MCFVEHRLLITSSDQLKVISTI